MSRLLIDRNPDLQGIRDEGFDVDVCSGYLVVRGIPHVDAQQVVHYDGVLATPLNLNGEVVNAPSTHTIKFCGAYPCDSSGRPIEALRHAEERVVISDRLATQYSFSCKPSRGHYESYHEQIRTYAAILSGPAANLDKFATPLTRNVRVPEDDTSPFYYIDTASARAEINGASQKLAREKIGIVGLGGSGSYVLDLVAKTQAEQIHLYDDDKFSSHNAFRAPGAASKSDLHQQKRKVEYLAEIYARMRKGIVPHDIALDASNAEHLRGMTFVFVCVDAGPAKRDIVTFLRGANIPFIDVGMGLYQKDDTIGGQVRVSLVTSETYSVVEKDVNAGAGQAEDIYDRNIQTADLNALNAALAVVKWKKYRAFYFDLERESQSTYAVASHKLFNEGVAM